MAREALGRGLGALFEGTNVATDTELMHVPLDQIRANPYQPRQRFDPQRLQELAESIRQQGVVQPIVVRRSHGSFELVAGERRLRAAQMAGFASIPALVKQASDREMLEFALLENLQREDLNPIEEARAYHRLQSEFRLRQGEVARRVGKDRSSVANVLRLLQLPSLIQDDVEAGRLSMGHARALLALDLEAEQLRLRALVLAEGLSVRATEERVRRLRQPHTDEGTPSRPAHVMAAEDTLRRSLGARVAIRAGRRSGKIEITYRGEEDLQRLLNLLQSAARARQSLDATDA
jgi:ParB family chromosome partitioning protein